MYKLLIFISLFSTSYAQQCVNFNNFNNKDVIFPLISSLHEYNITTYIDAKKRCKNQIYSPIKVLIESDNNYRNISIYFKAKKENSKIEYKNILIQDKQVKIYDLSKIRNTNSFRGKIIKRHSSIIADAISKYIK